jgi:hypothetical protein
VYSNLELTEMGIVCMLVGGGGMLCVLGGKVL